MATLTVLCEGATEQNFVHRVLKTHLIAMNTYPAPVDLGGRPTLSNLHRQINDALQSRRSHEYVTTMLDLYQLGGYPGNQPNGAEPVRDRVKRIEQQLFELYPNPNFIPYIQMHEFEALIFADVDKIRTAFPDGEADSGIPTLRSGAAGIEPELIDEGVDTAPSKRIIAAIPAYQHRKHSAGPEIVQEIGLEILRQACPHFGDWLTRLETLGGTT